MQATAPCRERDILHGRYRADLKVYIDAAHRLASATQDTFEVVYSDAERARAAWEQARSRLDSHILEHGCGEHERES